jgi:hypothetical protein
VKAIERVERFAPTAERPLASLPRVIGRLIAAVLLSDVVYLMVYASVQSEFDSGEAQCEGIGWGCTLGPGTQAGLWAGAVFVVSVLVVLFARAPRDVGAGLGLSVQKPPDPRRPY